MHSEFISSVAAIPAEEWNAVSGKDYPFSRHEFFSALEVSGATTKETGWQPHHLIMREDDILIAIVPLYQKFNSYGEYIFDWAWADAFHRNNMQYYPKLLSAIPFTPATGPRILYREDHIKDESEKNALILTICEALLVEANKLGVSSAHVLLSASQDAELLMQAGLMRRTSVQYHWRNKSYSSFENYLESFSSRKRKNLRKERRVVAEQGLTLNIFQAEEISDQHWQDFYRYYQMTYAKRSGHGGYLSAEFFNIIAKTLVSHLVMVVAEHEGQSVAAALNFRSKSTLYGRYWGCSKEFDFLHFEACYYQGIEFCIAAGLMYFDPGAQGEHKIQRGFSPVEVYSNHWIRDAQFSEAIHHFIDREAQGVRSYIEEASELLPFKKEQDQA